MNSFNLLPLCCLKYISSLEDILKELNKATVNKPSVDTLKDYAKRVDFLKKISKLNEVKRLNKKPYIN